MTALARILLLLAMLAPAALAQPAGQLPAAEPFAQRLAVWQQTLKEVSRELEAGAVSQARGDVLGGRLDKTLAQAQAAKQAVQSSLDALRGQLSALGAPPKPGQPPEPPDVAGQRSKLNTRIADQEGQVKSADLVLTQTRELQSRLSASTRARTVSTLAKRSPPPVLPDSLAVAVPAYLNVLGALVQAPVQWWQSLADWAHARAVTYRAILVLVLAIGLGAALRYALLRWFGPDPALAKPTYTRRVTAAVAEGLANGIIPALIFGGLLYAVDERREMFTTLFHDEVAGLCSAMIFLVLARALSRAVLAPDLPAWRVESFTPQNARVISHLITLLAVVFALDTFLVMASRSLEPAPEAVALHVLVVRTLEAVLIVALMRGRLWRSEEEEQRIAEAAEGEGEEGGASPTLAFWPTVRLAIRLTSLVAIVAAVIGYSNLSGFLVNGLVVSSAICGVLYLMRGLLRELTGAALRSDALQRLMGWRHATRRLLKFWLRGFLDLAIVLLAIVLVLPVWGVPMRDVWRWTRQLLQGVTIGSVTISITDLVAGVAVFATTVVLTRLAQRTLSQRVFPQTRLDPGIQHSLSAGVGYLGISIATALGVSTLGLDLSKLALVAGALSVGIGFGLQTVVNNFVSGLILLIERPIRVGDWIIAGGHEGIVRRIRVRSTEVETFQRASVIIPNSELISTPVINWTHQDKMGRVEAQVGIAYGSDIDEAARLLKGVLDAEKRILRWPAPYVLFLGFGASSLDFELRGYISNVDLILVIKSDLLLAVARVLKEADIEIPFPQQDVHLKDIDRLVAALAGRVAARTPSRPSGEDGGGA